MIVFTKEDFKLFKRFLKERGQYKFVMNYLFPKGRTLESFKKNIEELKMPNRYTFGDILHLTPCLGPSYFSYGHEFWERNIDPIGRDWITYYDLYKNNGKIS